MDVIVFVRQRQGAASMDSPVGNGRLIRPRNNEWAERRFWKKDDKKTLESDGVASNFGWSTTAIPPDELLAFGYVRTSRCGRHRSVIPHRKYCAFSQKGPHLNTNADHACRTPASRPACRACPWVYDGMNRSASCSPLLDQAGGLAVKSDTTP
jgi:hypothetical protein